MSLPFSDIDLKDGWKKLHKAGDKTLQFLTPDDGFIISDLKSNDIDISYKIGNNTDITRATWSTLPNSQTFGYHHLDKNNNWEFQGAYIPEDRPNSKLKTKGFYIDKKSGMGIIIGGKWEKAKEGDLPKANKTAFKHKDTSKAGTFEEMGQLWLKLTSEHDSLEAVKTAFGEAGYEILENQTLPTMYGTLETFNYNTWDDVAKAAVKNKEDWWKLVPKEGMGKFIGGGVAIGVAVAAAGIGLYQALKPKPKPKLIDING